VLPSIKGHIHEGVRAKNDVVHPAFGKPLLGFALPSEELDRLLVLRPQYRRVDETRHSCVDCSADQVAISVALHRLECIRGTRRNRGIGGSHDRGDAGTGCAKSVGLCQVANCRFRAKLLKARHGCGTANERPNVLAARAKFFGCGHAQLSRCAYDQSLAHIEFRR
jgi:hypothetical protein